MVNLNNRILKIFLKSIALLLIQAFLLLDLAFCPEANELFSKTQAGQITCLSPRLSMDISSFQRAYNLSQAALAESLSFDQLDTAPDGWKKNQKQEDININKFQSKNKAGLKLIAGICALIFTKLCLFLSISESANRISSFDHAFINTFIFGAALIASISIFRYFTGIRDFAQEQKTLEFNPQIREFLKDALTKNRTAASWVFASIIIGGNPLSGATEAVNGTKINNKPLVSRKGNVLEPKDLDNQRKEQVYVPRINPIKPNESRLRNTDTVTISEQARQLYSLLLINQSI
ncbi:MAG: hypothetical protein KKD05_02250 [Candidatus Omnitrophica bacterium]|nr:hypothetical protein [Candidatus Omnitrophota bacterium]